MGDRAGALEGEVRGRANEKSGAKKKRGERDSGEGTGVRGGSEARHSGIKVASFFTLTLAVSVFPGTPSIHTSNYLFLAGSLDVRFNRSADGLLFVRVFLF